MALVFLGGFILWLGWFGFNPGSTMAANPGAIAHVAMTTNLACCMAILSSTLTAWLMLGKPDFSMTVNGALAGLVAITAPCAFVSVGSSAIIGLIAGVIVVFAVLFFDKIKIDDPVGALSVHLCNGIWGTLAVGLFASSAMPGGGPDGLFNGGGFASLQAQAIGTLAVGAFTFTLALIAWVVIKLALGLRVDPDDETRGLDLSEMGMEAYPRDVLVG
jgi:Amt family ammonium transporter